MEQLLESRDSSELVAEFSLSSRMVLDRSSWNRSAARNARFIKSPLAESDSVARQRRGPGIADQDRQGAPYFGGGSTLQQVLAGAVEADSAGSIGTPALPAQTTLMARCLACPGVT